MVSWKPELILKKKPKANQNVERRLNMCDVGQGMKMLCGPAQSRRPGHHTVHARQASGGMWIVWSVTCSTVVPAGSHSLEQVSLAPRSWLRAVCVSIVVSSNVAATLLLTTIETHCGSGNRLRMRKRFSREKMSMATHEKKKQTKKAMWFNLFLGNWEIQNFKLLTMHLN